MKAAIFSLKKNPYFGESGSETRSWLDVGVKMRHKMAATLASIVLLPNQLLANTVQLIHASTVLSTDKIKGMELKLYFATLKNLLVVVLYLT